MTTSVRVRFVFTLGANLLRALLSFVTGMLLARWMGPRDYGNMSFLLGTFLGIRQLLDLGTSTAFFTFLSQTPRSRRFVNGFFVWLAIQFILPALAIAFVLPGAWLATVWHGEHRGVVLLAFAAAFMQNSAWPAVQQAAESQRKTLWVNSISVAIAIVHIIAVFVLWRIGALALPWIFLAISLEFLVAGIVAHQRFSYADDADDPDSASLGVMVRKYWVYCVPLIPYAFFGFAQEFADRWLLQNYGGGVQQAFYAVGAQFAAIALLATTSILRIFWKEVAEAHHRKDHQRAGELYRRVTRLLFLVGAICSGILLPWASEILRLVLGDAYGNGALTLAIMFLYPIHQSMGQIGGTMLYATERVSVVVYTGIGTVVLGLIVAYFVLAPSTATIPGLGLASAGLAAKMVLVQLVGVNVTAFLIARIFKWPFDWIFQPASILGCLAIGWASRALVLLVPIASVPVLIQMIVSGVIYMMGIAGFVYAFPTLAGLTRESLQADIAQIPGLIEKFRAGLG